MQCVVTADVATIRCRDSQVVSDIASITVDAPRAKLRVADAMHWGLFDCTPETSLRTVAALMSGERVHCVVVTENPRVARSLWGVVSDLDLVAAATVRPLDGQRAGGTAMKPAVTAVPHETLEDAARRMTEHGVSHLVVIDVVGQRPLGVLSALDVVDVLAEGTAR
jgi:CBS domain-containing protein